MTDKADKTTAIATPEVREDKQFPSLELHGLALYTAAGVNYVAQGVDRDFTNDDYIRKTALSYDDAAELMGKIVLRYKAAPELLASCQWLLSQFMAYADQNCLNADEISQRDAARAAIAKATGRTSRP